MLTSETIDRCRSYIGRSRTMTDAIAPEAMAKLAVLLGHHPADHIPLCWHWAYFNHAIPPENVGHDGHERLGLFLPDVPLPRRMWAAGEVEILSPLVIGSHATRVTTIEDVSFKQGRSGPLCFVTLRHDISQPEGPLDKSTGLRGQLRETQTIVYREPGRPEPTLRHPDDPVPEGFQTVADTTLFAYSAITQNGHRIHWDRDFCRDVENYPDLVVHGPLLATLLAGRLSQEPSPCVFKYRALAPVFSTSPIQIVAGSDEGKDAVVRRSDGVSAMTASLDL